MNKFHIGIILSIGLVVLMFWWIGFDFLSLWDAMRNIDPWYLAAATVLNLLFFVVRAIRWRYLMYPVRERVKVSHLLSATMIGFMVNNILPARLGELARAYAIGKKENVPTSSSFATIVVERVFDGLSVFLLLVIVLAFMPESLSAGSLAATIQRTKTVSLIGSFLLIIVLGLFLYKQEYLEKVTGSLFGRISSGWAEKAVGLVRKFMSGLNVIKQPRLLGLIIFYSFLHWGFIWAPILLIFKGYGVNLGIYEALFTFVVIAFAVALPSTPGFIGTFHAAVAAALMLLGIHKEQAVAMAIVMWAMGFVPVTLIGLIYLWKEELTIGSIKTAEAGVEK